METNVVPIAGERIVSSLRVLNDNEFAIEDMFDGVPYTFKPGQPLTIPGDAAAHILGWHPGVDMKVVKQHVTKRWGWNTPAMMTSGDAEKFFSKVTLHPVRFKLVEVAEPEAVELEPEADKPASNRGTGGRFARKEASAQP